MEVPDFTTFYRREYRSILAIAWTLTGDLGAAEDVTQEAFLRASTKWSKVDPRTMRVTATVPAKCDGGWRTRVGNYLWAIPGPDSRDLLIIDVGTAKILHRVPLGDPGGWMGSSNRRRRAGLHWGR